MEYEIKFKKFDKKRSIDAQVNDLISEIKQIGVKIIENSRLNNGYGEGVCLVLTQLLDKYLIIRNFIFKKPKLNDPKENIVIEELHNDIEEVILEDHVNNSTSNRDTQKNSSIQPVCSDVSNINLRNNMTLKDIVKNRYSSGRKRWSSAMSNITQGNHRTI
jgi:hypothetical protein